MSGFPDIKSRLFHFVVNRQLKHRPIERKTIPYEQARSIGILFRTGNAEEIQAIEHFRNELQQDGKQVDTLAYLERKRDASLHPPHIPCFSRGQVNLLGIPRNQRSAEFQKREYDLLICAWLGRCLPLRYLALTSRAAWRIGEYRPDKESSAELLLQLHEEHYNLPHFLEQVRHYLKSIHTHETRPISI